MKTCNTVYEEGKHENGVAGRQLLPLVLGNTRKTLALLGAAIAAVGLVILSIWATGLETIGFLGAITWGLGFIFLALAVDNYGSMAILQLSSGIALIVLASLQNQVSADFLIGAGVLAATWVAALTYRQLR